MFRLEKKTPEGWVKEAAFKTKSLMRLHLNDLFRTFPLSSGPTYRAVVETPHGDSCQFRITDKFLDEESSSKSQDVIGALRKLAGR